jgi:hypothetical protein
MNRAVIAGPVPAGHVFREQGIPDPRMVVPAVHVLATTAKSRMAGLGPAMTSEISEC